MSSPAFKCHKPPHNIEQSDRAFLPIFSPMVLAFHFIFFHILCTTKPSMRGLWDTPQWSRKRSAQEDQVHGLGGYIHEHTQAFRFALTAPHRCVSHHREPLRIICIVLPPRYCLLFEKAICIEILTYQFIKYVLKLRSMCLCDPLEVTALVYRSNFHCRVVYLRTLIFLWSEKIDFI